MPAPDAPNRTAAFLTQPERHVERQPGMDPMDEPDIEPAVDRLVHRRVPREGSVRWTSQSAAIEMREMARVSRPARAVSSAR